MLPIPFRFRLCVLLMLTLTTNVHSWPGHDVSTLRLLQIVHTHGDRTPSHFVHNDPYADTSLYWPEGVGQLTKKGRHRMYRIGEFLNEAYENFLANQSTTDCTLEQFLYVRSSGSKRCLESASLLATAFIGDFLSTQNNKRAQETTIPDYNYLTNYWRPIPVHSITPKGSDPMLDATIPCPNAEIELDDTMQQEHNVKMQRIHKEDAAFLTEISRYAGEEIGNLKAAYDLYQELFIERQHDYHWWKEPFNVWSEDYETYAVSKLRELSRLYWTIQYDNRILQTLQAGPLIKELNSNIRRYIDGTNQRRRVYIYSTHDNRIALILHALGVFDSNLIPAGATLLLELHQNTSLKYKSKDPMHGYFVRLYYFNETYTNEYAYEMISERICVRSKSRDKAEWSCPVRHYLDETGDYEPYDWLYQCGLKMLTINYFVVNLHILATNFLLLMMLFVLLRIYSSRFRARCHRIRYTNQNSHQLQR